MCRSDRCVNKYNNKQLYISGCFAIQHNLHIDIYSYNNFVTFILLNVLAVTWKEFVNRYHARAVARVWYYHKNRDMILVKLHTVFKSLKYTSSKHPTLFFRSYTIVLYTVYLLLLPKLVIQLRFWRSTKKFRFSFKFNERCRKVLIPDRHEIT